MTSEKQSKANRRNALKSSGPKTPEGKNVARLNAVKHGLLSQTVLLPGEDAETLKKLGESLRAELQPVGELEGMFVDLIIGDYWRLCRLKRVETGIFASQLYDKLLKRAQMKAKSYERSALSHLIENRYGGASTKITDEQKHQEALSKVQEIEAKQEDDDSVTLGRTFIRDANNANAFSKLSRYEASIERSLYKALHELQRLQAARLTESNVPPPVALDVDVSGISSEGS